MLAILQRDCNVYCEDYPITQDPYVIHESLAVLSPAEFLTLINILGVEKVGEIVFWDLGKDLVLYSRI